METMYQRSRIQEESLYYETLKHTGEFPIIGVNTFLSSKGSPTILPKEVIRATEDEKQYQIAMLRRPAKGQRGPLRPTAQAIATGGRAERQPLRHPDGCDQGLFLGADNGCAV
jgi:methylmalonyl-CoA mutase